MNDPAAAGRELLPSARALLAAADRIPDGRRPAAPETLRVDVWTAYGTPEAIVSRFGAEHPELPVEMSRRGDFGSALEALRRREIDAAFGSRRRSNARAARPHRRPT